MACDLEILREVPLFALLDDDELAVLAEQVGLEQFRPRQRIYRMNDPAGHAYVVVSGAVQVTTIDDDHQDVLVAQPDRRVLRLSSFEQTPHQTNAVATDDTTCLRSTVRHLRCFSRSPCEDGHADRARPADSQYQRLVRVRASRNPNG